MPFKHNASRRHRIPRARYKVTNWAVPGGQHVPRDRARHLAGADEAEAHL